MEKLEGFIGENPMSIAEDLVFIQGQKAEEQAIIREKNWFLELLWSVRQRKTKRNSYMTKSFLLKLDMTDRLLLKVDLQDDDDNNNNKHKIERRRGEAQALLVI